MTFTTVPDLPRLQRASPDLAAIIEYVLTGKSPDGAHSAEVIQKDAVDCYIDKDGLRYHVQDSRRRNPNSVIPIIMQIAVPDSLRTQVLDGFREKLDHFRL